MGARSRWRVVSRPRMGRGRAAITVAAALLAGCGDDRIALPEDAVESAEHTFRVVHVAGGFEHPWGMAFLPGGEILVTERPGRLRSVRGGTLIVQPVTGVPAVAAIGQGGLLDVALHPDFVANRLVYLSYAKAGPRGATTAVARGRYADGALTDVEEIFEANAWSAAAHHFGSRLVFDAAGFLYVTVGDRGDMQRAQDLRDHAGATVRLHDDGRVPADNPFVGESVALPDIYAFGIRNAQGLALHPETGAVWLNEHGPRGGDEINFLRAGANYGWPLVTHGVNYDGTPITDRTEAPGIDAPVLHWTPSIAPSGMAFYAGDAFPRWRGDAFVGALVGQHLRRVVLEGTRVVAEERLLEGIGRVRDVRTGPDGYVYLLLDAPEAPLLRLEPVH